MLTAKASEESRIESLTQGVDSYLTKPFSPVELRLMVRNLISLKREMQRKALENKDAPIQLPDSRDQQFYNEFLALADKHLDNSDLSADDLVVQLGISRTQLHRKLKGITGLSAMQLIRRIRLQKALEMLKRNDATIAEIGFRVGFSSPSHFAQSFRQQFGYPPSEVKR